MADSFMVTVIIPNFFKCPISSELMKDPVTLCTGQTYDRLSIQEWFESGHKTCPSTMQVLSNLDIVPNETLRHLIQDWFATNSRFAVPISTPETDGSVERKEIKPERNEGPGQPSPLQTLVLTSMKGSSSVLLRLRKMMTQNSHARGSKGYHKLPRCRDFFDTHSFKSAQSSTKVQRHKRSSQV